MALRLLLRRNQWNTKKPGILLGSINHRLCHSSSSTTTTAIGITLGPHIHVPETSFTRDDQDRRSKIPPCLGRRSKIPPENIIGGCYDDPEAHKDERFISVAQFAVFIINGTNTRRDNSKRLEFVRVVSGKVQLVSGLLYYITLVTASIDDDDDEDGRFTSFYDVKLLKKGNTLTLLSWR